MGNPQPLPGGHEGLHDIDIALARHRRQGDGIAISIDDMDAVEPTPAVQVARTHEVQLVDVVGPLDGHGGIRFAPGLIQGPDQQPVATEDPVDGPDRGGRHHTQLVQLPLNGKRPPLGVLGSNQPAPDLADQALHRCGGLRGPAVRGPRLGLRPAGSVGCVPLEPVIEPPARAAVGPTDSTDPFPLEKSPNRIDASVLFFHRPPPCWRWKLTDGRVVTNVLLQNRN